jgi:hypothetical protein
VGWRGWFVVEHGGALHLSSPVYETLWLPRQETLARCRSRREAWSWSAHAAPAEDCDCGLYAARSPADAAALLSERRWARACHALQAVLGRVLLWGSVVECEQGWRAERAYPAALYLSAPQARRSRLGRLLPRGQSAIPACELARGLSAYGVAVELIASRTLSELADTLAADPSLSLESACV